MGGKLIWVGILLAIVLAVAALFQAGNIDVQTMAEGDTNLTNLVLSGDASVGDDLTVTDDATITDALTAADLTATDDLVVGDDVTITGSLTGALNSEHIRLPTLASTAFTYTAAAGGTINLFTVGAGETWIVHGVWLSVTTNFECAGNDCVATIGDGNDVDGFCVLADAELQAADTEGTGWSAGWQCQVAATRGVYQDGTGGFVYNEASAETIDVILSAAGNDFSTGEATAYILYTRIQ